MNTTFFTQKLLNISLQKANGDGDHDGHCDDYSAPDYDDNSDNNNDNNNKNNDNNKNNSNR